MSTSNITPNTAATAPLGTTNASSSSSVAKSYDPPSVDESNPVSAVADHDYPNVPENTGVQEAATGPGTGGRAGIQQTSDHHIEHGSLKQQVGGYAKKLAGAVTGNKEEKRQGEAEVRGDV